MAESKKMPESIKFLLGGTAGILGTCVVQPLDLVKTRMQLSAVGGAKKEYKNSMDCIKKVVRQEGPFAIYKGIGAAVLRQATYTTARLGVYTYLNDVYRSNYSGAPTLLARMAMGVVAGGCGAIVGTPAEVALIRMTADGRLPANERRNYTNVANALKRITKEEGAIALWRGCIPTVGRAMVVNMAQLASYSQSKDYFSKNWNLKEGVLLHFSASMVSGFITSITSMPVDIAKTRIQNMTYKDGKPQYRGTVDVITKIAKQEGILALWKGFTPYYGRLAPHTVLIFVFLEKLTSLYNKHVLGKSGTGSSI